MRTLALAVSGSISAAMLMPSTAFSQTKRKRLASNAEVIPAKPASTPGPRAGLMTTSTSAASGMSMAAKYMPTDFLQLTSAHPITSLRKNQSDAQFDLGVGQVSSETKSSGTGSESDVSLMHIGLGATAVLPAGVRLGAHVEIADDPIKVKLKSPFNTSTKVKASAQDVSFFAAAGVTSQFGLGLNVIMADRKVGDTHETATIMSPAVMGMFDKTEVTFDLIQSNDDVGTAGHWRVAAVHRLENSTFLTGHLMRMQPTEGDDYWDMAVGARKKQSTLGSFGAEFLYSQQHDGKNSECSAPGQFGVRADIDHELSTSQVVSAGAAYGRGSCSSKGTEKTTSALELKGAFTMAF